MNPTLLVIAKAPVPGRVKTRLCPPCSPEQAALIARAALDDTLSTVDRCPAPRRILVMDGEYAPPTGWDLVRQRGHELGERLAHAFTDATAPGLHGPALLVGMDTPQLTPAVIAALARGLERADAILGPAADGGWWGLALRDPADAKALMGVPMSTSDTGRMTATALRDLGLRVTHGPLLRDVDTAADARAVAAQSPTGAFAAAVRAHMRG